MEPKITSEGFGEDRPAISTADDEQHQHNRRVETTVTLPATAAPTPIERPDLVASLENGSASVTDANVTDESAGGTTGSESAAETAKLDVPSGDGVPTLPVESVSGSEGDPDLTLDLRLSPPSSVPVVLIVTQLNDTATAGQDVESAPSVITLKPGETGTQLKTVLIDDDVIEAEESFSLQISGSREHVELPDEPITITIEDDD